MIMRIIFVLIISTVSSYASDVLKYKSNDINSLSKLLSYKETQLQDDLYLGLDLSYMLSLVDERFERDMMNPLEKHTNPDKPVITTS